MACLIGLVHGRKTCLEVPNPVRSSWDGKSDHFARKGTLSMSKFLPALYPHPTV
jgi:hypothetical protein